MQPWTPAGPPAWPPGAAGPPPSWAPPGGQPWGPGWAPPPPPPPRAGQPAAPVAEGEREWVVDALRAVALLGIVVVNVAGYRQGVGPSLAAAGGRVGGETSPVTVVVSGLTEGRFYPLFSFLFGWGFAVQHARARERGLSLVGPWVRRSLVLLVLGLLHWAFLFDGDILTTYALVGVCLLAVQWVPAGWLAGIGVTLVVLQALFTTGLVALGAAVTDDPIAVVRAQNRQALVDDAAVYGHGSFADVVDLRIGSLPLDVFLGLLTFGGTVAGMMCLGMAAARGRWLSIERWPPWLGAGALPAWLVGLAVSVPAAWLQGSQALGSDDPGEAALGWLGYSLLGPVVALLWALALVRLAATRAGGAGLRAIAPAGRMSLTLYLLQSLVASLVFVGYGLGLGDDVGIGVALGLVAGLWVLQVVGARLWFRHFAMGPLEAVARAGAYLRWPGLRRQR